MTYASASPTTTGSGDRPPPPRGVIPSQRKQYNDVAETTFGPLEKYVPANDNFAGAKSWANGGVVGPVTDVPTIINRDYVVPRSLYERLTAKVPVAPATSTTADFVGINYADDDSPVVPELTAEDWQRHEAETSFAFRQAEPQDRGQYIGLARPSSLDSGRHGDFMQTYTGRKFWPMDPRPDEIFIEDIAHSLSLQCRYAGHCHRFYSVAEHSVLMARHLRWEGVDVALWALLHDASEAYLVDVPRPVKPYLAGYKEAESKVMAAVCERFGLATEMPAAVHDADTRIIGDELVNMTPMDWHARYNDPLGVSLRYWSPAQAETEFLATFEALMECRARGME